MDWSGPDDIVVYVCVIVAVCVKGVHMLHSMMLLNLDILSVGRTFALKTSASNSQYYVRALSDSYR